MKRSSRILITILSLVIFVVSVLTAVTSSIFELDFYTNSQIKHNVAQNMGLEQKEVTEATTVALLYTKGITSDLTYIKTIDGEQVDLYSSQDKEHMIDVQNLYKNVYYVLLASAISLLIVAIVLLFKRKEVNVFGLTLQFNKVSLYTLIFVATLGIFAFVNFDKFWTMFHKVFFTNDLWLMDYKKDLLVNLFPEGLFMDLVFKILFRFALIFGLVNITAFLYRAYSLREI